MATTNPQIDQWRKELKVIHNDIVTLANNRRLFRDIFRIVNKNKRLPKSNAVYGWMIDGYVALATSAVRRQVDERSDVVSFANLLTEIAACPLIITRAWFVGQYHHPAVTWADKDFDTFDRPRPRRDVVRRWIVTSDYNRLKSTASVVGKFTNKYVAHRDKNIALGKAATAPKVTWKQLNKAVDVLGKLLAKYELLLNQGSLLRIEPVIQDDWKAVFRLPWIAI